MTDNFNTPLSPNDQLLVDWRKAAQNLEIYKITEMELRKQVMKAFFPDPKKGTQRINIGFGYNLKLVYNTTYTLDEDKEKVENALGEIANIGNDGPFVTGRLINWKPSLVAKEYKGLSAPHKAAIDKVLTTKDASPSLEIEEPKEKK